MAGAAPRTCHIQQLCYVVGPGTKAGGSYLHEGNYIDLTDFGFDHGLTIFFGTSRSLLIQMPQMHSITSRSLLRSQAFTLVSS